MDKIITREIPGEVINIAMDVWTAPFWEAGKQSRLVVACCGECGAYRMPPGPFCPECQSQKIDWAEQKNRGILYTYTVVDRSPYPGVVENFRWVAAIVELPDAGNVRIAGNIVGATAAALSIGMPLEIFWGPINDGWKVPLFRLVRD